MLSKKAAPYVGIRQVTGFQCNERAGLCFLKALWAEDMAIAYDNFEVLMYLLLFKCDD